MVVSKSNIMSKPDLDEKLDSKTSEKDSDYLKETLKQENGNISVDELFIITPGIWFSWSWPETNPQHRVENPLKSAH